MQLSNLDIGVIAAYLLVIIAIGFTAARRTRTDEDLFLGGRSLTWSLIGLSLFASNISSTTLVGLSGAAYGSGIAVSNYEWLAGVPLVLAAAVFVPIYLRARITTVPEYLELRYDRRSRLLFSGTTITISIIVDTAGGLYAGAVVLQTFMPDLVLWHAIVALAVFAGVYTAFGGLRAVVYTDVLQAIILIGGGCLLTLTLFAKLDFSWATVTATVPGDRLSVIRPLDDPGLPWLGTLVGVPLLGFWYWVTNQYVTQRVLAARSIEHARRGILLAGFLKLLPLFIMVLPGAMAIALLPPIDNPDQIFALMVTEFLPVGITGLVLAGLISAILSSVDSTLNSASTLIVKDFVQPARPGLAPEAVARWGRMTTLCLMVIAAIWAPMIMHFGGLWTYLQQVFAIIVPPVATIFLLGVFVPPGTARAAIWTLGSGFALGIILFALRQIGVWPLHFSIDVGIAFAACCLIYLFVSKIDPDPPGRIVQRDALVYRRGITAPDAGERGWRDYRWQSAALIGGMVMILVLFW